MCYAKVDTIERDRFMSSRKFFLMLIYLLTIIIFAGCGKNDDEQEPERPQIAGIVFQEDQFFRLVEFGMKEAAGERGVELFVSNSSNKPDKEIQLVNTYIVRGVDAIVISPLSKKASVAALRQAHDKGVKLITYNTTIEGDIPSAYIESDQEDLGSQSGKAAREYIEDNLGGEAKIALLGFRSLAPEQSDSRRRGFVNEILKIRGAEIIAEQDAWLPETAIKKAGDILTAHVDVDIIWAANEGGTVGSVMAVKSAGRVGETVVFGTDISEQLIGFLLSEDAILQAITGQRPFEIGKLALESAVKVVKGEEVERRVSMPGVLLSRREPEKVKEFSDRLSRMIRKGSK